MAEDKQFELSMTVGDASFTASGPEALVKEALAEFKALVEAEGAGGGGGGSDTGNGGGGKGSSRRRRRRGTATRKRGRKPEGATADRDPIDASKMTLPQLLNEANLRGNHKIATAIIIWAADHENKDGLEKDDVEKYWKRTSVKVPANLPRDLGKAVKQGWIDEDEGTYSPQGYGRSELGFK